MYSFLVRLLSPLILLLLAIEAFKKGGWPFFLQRAGWQLGKLPKNAIWIHCASVGEVKSVEPLVKKLQNQHKIFITTSTPTGADLVKNCFENSIPHHYLPFDWVFAIKRFIKHTQPQQLWVMETEIWLNLYRQTAKANIPVKLFNARLSKKTLKAPNWLKQKYRTALSFTSLILTRCESEKQRFIELGADASKIKTLGNIKFATLHLSNEHTPPLETPYVVLASSHEDEELQMVKVWQKLNPLHKLIIIPRHPKRSEAIQKALNTLVNLGVHSQGDSPKTFEVFMDDRIGVMMDWMSGADVVIMGGAFVNKGGHNILEPASLKKAIITGQDMSDFEPETELLLQHNGLKQCANYQEVEFALKELLTQAELRETMGKQAYQALQSQAHILEDYTHELLSN